ncbi:MAG: hypothetical protein ACREPK_05450 [Rhodanobacteraceae bacterium]
MLMRARGPGAGWSWLMEGFTVANRQPRQILGACLLLILCAAVLVAVQLLTQWALRPQGFAAIAMFAAFTLAGSILYPILMGGFMGVIDASRNDRQVRVLMVFEPFRKGYGGSRLALFGLCMLVIYAAFLAILLTTVGHGLLSWYLQLLDQQALGTPVRSLPPLPGGSSTALALLTVFFIFYSCAFAIGTGQVALRNQSPLPALRDGIAGAFKNALPLLVLSVCGLVALLVLAVGFGVLAAILLVVGALVSRPLGVVLLVLIYVALAVLLYAFMMGVDYALWHDVADGSRSNATRSPLPIAEE